MVAFVFYLLKLPQDLSILANLSSTTACVVHMLKQITSFNENIQLENTRRTTVGNLHSISDIGHNIPKNGCNAHTEAQKSEKMTFENFDLRPLWPYRLCPCGRCNLAEILHAFQVVLKTSEHKISLHLVQKWLSYNTFYISAMAFYLVTLLGC